MQSLDAAASFGFDLLLIEGAGSFKRVADKAAELCFQGEDAGERIAEELTARNAEEALHGVRDQGGAALGGEQQDAILQVRHDRVEVLLHGGEDFLDVAHAAPDALDFVGDLKDGVLGRGTDEASFFRRRELGGRRRPFGKRAALFEAGLLQRVQAPADLFNRLQGEVGEQRSYGQ